MEAELLEEHQTEITFVLPTDRGQRSYFADMFEDLDSRKTELGIVSYGVADTTLEQVTSLHAPSLNTKALFDCSFACVGSCM